MIQSNGTPFASEAHQELLRIYQIFCVNFSLHGPAEVHNALVGSPTAFALTCAALKSAAVAGTRTASNLVLNAHNAHPEILEATVALLHELGCREMTVTRFIPTGFGANQPLSISPEEYVCSLLALEKATRRFDLSLLLANSAPACEFPDRLRHLCNRCSFGFDKFYVDVNLQNNNKYW
jgi:MoaA/NifB/PqqE/SkfB family radical SAM enzyme